MLKLVLVLPLVTGNSSVADLCSCL